MSQHLSGEGQRGASQALSFRLDAETLESLNTLRERTTMNMSRLLRLLILGGMEMLHSNSPDTPESIRVLEDDINEKAKRIAAKAAVAKDSEDPRYVAELEARLRALEELLHTAEADSQGNGKAGSSASQ